MEITPIVTLIIDTIKKAVEEKHQCYVTLKYYGTNMYSYQDKLGYSQRLEYYTHLSDGRDGTLFLELVTKRGGYNDEPVIETREGCFHIDWTKVHSASINEHSSGKRHLIKIDNLEINFL